MDKLGGILVMLSILAAELAWYNSREGDQRKAKAFRVISLVGFAAGVGLLVGFALWYNGYFTSVAQALMG